MRLWSCESRGILAASCGLGLLAPSVRSTRWGERARERERAHVPASACVRSTALSALPVRCRAGVSVCRGPGRHPVALGEEQLPYHPHPPPVLKQIALSEPSWENERCECSAALGRQQHIYTPRV